MVRSLSRSWFIAALLSCLFSVWLSPSVASELPDRLSDQQWAKAYNLPIATSLLAESSEPISREDFVISTLPYIETVLQLSYHGWSTAEDYSRIHFNAVEYVAPRIAQTRREADRLIAEAETVDRGTVKQVQKADVMGTAIAPTKNSSTKSSLEKDDLALENANKIKDFAIVDMTMADGTFQLDQPLTKGDYVSYLRQIESALAKQDFDAESLLDVDFLQIPPDRTAIPEASDNLSVLFEDWDSVRALVDELKILIETSPERRKRQSSHEKVLSVSAKLTATPTLLAQDDVVTSIGQVPDVSPSDPAFEPLQRLIEEMGIRVLSADGNFNGQSALTRGEFATHIETTIQVIWHGSGLPREVRELSALARIYSELSQELQITEQALQAAISRLSPSTQF